MKAQYDANVPEKECYTVLQHSLISIVRLIFTSLCGWGILQQEQHLLKEIKPVKQLLTVSYHNAKHNPKFNPSLHMMGFYCEARKYTNVVQPTRHHQIQPSDSKSHVYPI